MVKPPFGTAANANPKSLHERHDVEFVHFDVEWFTNTHVLDDVDLASSLEHRNVDWREGTSRDSTLKH